MWGVFLGGGWLRSIPLFISGLGRDFSKGLDRTSFKKVFFLKNSSFTPNGKDYGEAIKNGLFI